MKVVVVDYGMGNLHSVLKSVQAAQKALAGVRAEIELTVRPKKCLPQIKSFSGQGAMPDCMAALQQSGLGEAVSDGLKNKPFRYLRGRAIVVRPQRRDAYRAWAGLPAR